MNDNNGYFINAFSDNDSDQLLKYGIGESITVDQTNAKPNGYYLNGHIDRAEKPLLKVNSNTFETVTANNDGNNNYYYYLNNGNYPLIECSSSTSCSEFKSFYQSTSYGDSSDYYVINGEDPTSLIKCIYDSNTDSYNEQYSCRVMNKSDISPGYYINSGRNSGLILNTGSDFTEVSPSSIVYYTTPLEYGYNLIIQCSYTSCRILENTNGYFISGESDNTQYPLIKCGNDGCNKIAATDIKSECSTVGDIISVASTEPDKSDYCLCTKSTNFNLVKISSQNTQYYEFEADEQFIDNFTSSSASSAHVLVKVGNNSVNVVKENDSRKYKKKEENLIKL